jgi:hypothetical protein
MVMFVIYFCLTVMFLVLFTGIMTLTRTPCDFDTMSLFQDLKLKRRKLDSRCSSDGKCSCNSFVRCSSNGFVTVYLGMFWYILSILTK